ncbi:MAG: VWA domain-containing protein [Candidatus Eremiobacteraeota bacterium]|nr:VWA domain-containing protein [Candidatus Eremiobacteraeota bacterium]
MRWAIPESLTMLLLVPLLIIFYVMMFDRKRKAKERFAKSFSRLAPLLSLRKQKVKALLVVLAVIFLVLALAGPQWGEREKTIQSKGVDVFIAIDCSQSMLAEDYKPSRLAFAKTLLKKMADNLQGNRIGVIAFSGAAYIECPLTIDISAVKMYIDDLDPSSIPIQGTSLADAIDLAVKSYPRGAKGSKALIILSDGESLEGDALNAAKLAAREHVRIYTIGVGTPEGTEIPLKNAENAKIAPKTDVKGKIVISKLDEKSLKELAQSTGGMYLRASYDERSMMAIANTILGMEKKEFGTLLQKQYIERFQYPLFMALVLLVIEALISETKGGKRAQITEAQ